jgi:CTP:molybdopterin cytidylyltransferase MocA
MPKPPLVKGIILAAGLSSRMGECKPLMMARNKTIIENSIDSMIEGGVSSLLLVVGYRGKEIEEKLGHYSKEAVTIVYNDDFATTDMLYSLQLGLRSLGTCDAFFLLPADMPDIQPSTFQSVRQCWIQTNCLIAFPTLGIWRKHPPLIDAKCIDTILAYKGQGGLRTLWKYFEGSIATVAVDDLGCETDLDTMEDYSLFLKRISPGNPIKQEVGAYGYQ